MKDKYYDLRAEGLSFDDFYIMSEQFFPYKGLPVIYRDILYNLIGYFYAVSENPDETLDFYTKLIKDNQQYVQRKKNVKFYINKGCKPEAIDYAEFVCNNGTENAQWWTSIRTLKYAKSSQRMSTQTLLNLLLFIKKSNAFDF